MNDAAIVICLNGFVLWMSVVFHNAAAQFQKPSEADMLIRNHLTQLKAKLGVLTLHKRMCAMRLQITCDVVWRATVAQLDGRGGINGYESLGDFETEQDAEQKLADKGFTRTP